jgi:hypothetical protein
VHLVFPSTVGSNCSNGRVEYLSLRLCCFRLIWLLSGWLLRSSYVSLLVQSAEQGRLGFSDVDLRAFKRAVVEALEQPGTEADKRSCIQLLYQIDPTNVGEVLAPLIASAVYGTCSARVWRRC